MPRAVAEARHIWARVQRFCGRSIDLDDLEQIATWELFQVAERWRDWYGKPLWSFARRSVRTKILRAVRQASRGTRLPFHLTESDLMDVPSTEGQIDARRAWQEQLISQETTGQMAARLGYGDEPAQWWTVAMLAEKLGVSRRRVTAMLTTGILYGERAPRAGGGVEWRVPDHAAVDIIGSRLR